MTSFTLNVQKLTCINCVRKVQNVLLECGARDVSVQLDSGLATGVFNDDPNLLVSAVEAAGKPATLISAPPAAPKLLRLRVDGMTCMGCVRKISSVLEKLANASDVHVDLESKLATLMFSDDPQIAVQAVHDAGKSAIIIDDHLEEPSPDAIANTESPVQSNNSTATDDDLVALDLSSPQLKSEPAILSTPDHVLISISDAPESAQVTTNLRVAGMTCSSCVSVVEDLLTKLPGVNSARVNLLAGRATVVHQDELTSPVQLADAVSSAGYQATVLHSTNSARNHIVTEYDAEFRIDFQSNQQAQNAVKLLRFMEGVYEVDSHARTVSVSVTSGCTKSTILHALEFDGSFGKMSVRHSRSAELEEIANGDGQGATSVIDEEANMWRRRFLLALFFFLPIAATGLLQTFTAGIPFGLMMWIHFALSTPIQFICGSNFYRASYFALRKGRATMDVLVALSTSIAYFSSAIVLLFGLAQAGNSNLGHTVMFKVSAMIVTMVLLGKWIEASAKRKAAAGVAQLSALAPEKAILFDEKHQVSCHTEVPVKVLDVGDVVRVIPGDRVPVDGEVIDGTSAINESMLTGESRPVPKLVGDHVYGGTVNDCGSLLIRTTAIGSDAVLSQIVKLVNDAQTSRAPVESYADKVSGVFVPCVVFFSALVFTAWYSAAIFEWIPQEWYAEEGPFFFALLFALETMVIACPCALGLATPTAVMVASEVGAKHGVLFRGGGAAIEAAKNVGHVVFDKTGTLTVGTPQVTAFITSQRTMVALPNASSVLQDLVYVVESQSHHPLAHAISNYVADLEGGRATENEAVYKVSWIEEVPGRGMKALVNKSEFSVLVGSRDFAFSEVAESELFSEAEIREIDHMEANEGLTIVAAVVNKRYGCVFGLEDTVRPEAREVVETLHSMGVGTSLVTGDSAETGRAVANKVGIPLAAVHARAMPWSKVDIVQDLEPSCFVGDGINDAPALAAASMGIAIGAGAPVAAESAAVVLVGDDLRGVVNAIGLARTAFRRVRLNFCWAIGYNIVSIPLAAGILYPMFQIRVPPFVASGAMALSSTCVILSSLALRWYRPQLVSNDALMEIGDRFEIEPTSSAGSLVDLEAGTGSIISEEINRPLLT
ncbi:haloacid dehalogenase-like hydrolase [Gracilaria domingensis]|nr:haloacid dehalogenase-like hydrolase [Gracilaria domingensis]